MSTRDLTPQDEGNGPYVPNADGAGVRGNTGDSALDEHTETHDSVLPPEGVHGAEGSSDDKPADDGSDSDDSASEE